MSLVFSPPVALLPRKGGGGGKGSGSGKSSGSGSKGSKGTSISGPRTASTHSSGGGSPFSIPHGQPFAGRLEGGGTRVRSSRST